MSAGENPIIFTSLFQYLLQLLSLQAVSDITTLRTSLLLQWIVCLIPEVLDTDSVNVQILSVSLGRAVEKLVQDVVQ